MAAAQVSFDLKEIDAVRKTLAEAALDSGDRQRLLGSIGKQVEGQTKERFSTQRSPDGDTWKALAQKTRDYYRSNGKGHRSLLVGEGGLRDSVTSEVHNGAWSTLVGATKEYAAVHQFGETITPKTAKALMVPGYGMLRKVNIPARPYLGVSENDASEIASLVATFLERSFK